MPVQHFSSSPDKGKLDEQLIPTQICIPPPIRRLKDTPLGCSSCSNFQLKSSSRRSRHFHSNPIRFFILYNVFGTTTFQIYKYIYKKITGRKESHWCIFLLKIPNSFPNIISIRTSIVQCRILSYYTCFNNSINISNRVPFLNHSIVFSPQFHLTEDMKWDKHTCKTKKQFTVSKDSFLRSNIDFGR